MTHVTSVPLRAPIEDDQRPWVIRAILMAAAGLSIIGATYLHRPIIAAEPVFTTINVAVIATLITLGLYLVLRQREGLSGLAFAVAGATWSISALDGVFPAWGPYVTWTFAGTTYVAIGWAILRYRRRRLETTAEMAFVPIAIALTVGTSFAAAFVVPPWILGFPADTFWPVVYNRPAISTGAIAVVGLGFLALGGFFCVLMAGMVRRAPYVGRAALRPMAMFGAFFAVGSAVVQAGSAAAPDVVGPHYAVIAVGVLLLALSAALAVSMMLQEMVGSRFLAQLPLVRTPETVSTYLRTVLGDPTVELLYWSPESSVLVDDTGRRRPLQALPPAEQRFSSWIHGSDRGRIALLTGDPALGRDKTALDTLSGVLSIVAENARLNVLLRMRVAELTATRTAESLAFDKAREEFHRNLHDGLQQTIATVRMDLDGLHDVMATTDGQRVVTDLEAKLTLALEQVHSLKRGTNPPELRFGLKPAIQRTVAELRLTANCRVSETDLGILTLPVYYLVKESLTNVHKHAHANLVEIDVATDGRSVNIVVRDDGVGGATAYDGGGIGGMRRRVEELGGQLDCRSPSGSGTTVHATIPCVS